ncbi:Uncharacterized protein SCF082_LOCUS11060 [Durusdinium trenchii]|uniref:Uncharacterized protein n=2 Tax=Durusdinium trenchii TaxID=1381693 RepID=A0ABP0JAH2_9DINO
MCLSLLKLRMSASRGRKVIATFQICSHPGRGHAFPVPSCFQLEPCEAEERDEREKAAGEFLKRVGSKLAFNPEELVAMTLDIDIPLPGALHGSCACASGAVREPSCTSLSDILMQISQELRPQVLLHVRSTQSTLEPNADEELFPSSTHEEPTPQKQQSDDMRSEVPSSRRAPAQAMRRLQKQSPAELRLQAQALWNALEKAKVCIPPLEAEKPVEKFHLERHGHGRGNTKSTKKRRKRADRADLSRLILHLQQLALEHGIEPDASEEVMQEVQEDSSDSAS